MSPASLALASFLAGFGTACAVMALIQWREDSAKRARHQQRLGSPHG